MQLHELNPGDSIQLGDITQLPAFEDMVAEQVDPTMTSLMREAWAGRTAIRDLVRPPKFNGTIADIELVVMAMPYDRLSDARDRGWSFGRDEVLITLTKDDEIINSFRGFTFLANAKSSGRGIIGQIQAELWFARVPVSHSHQSYTSVSGNKTWHRHNMKKAVSNGGASVRRYVTKPKIETTKFVNLNEISRRIGFELLRNAMLHPIVQPMHQ